MKLLLNYGLIILIRIFVLTSLFFIVFSAKAIAQDELADMFNLLSDPFGMKPCLDYNDAQQNCAAAGNIDKCISIKLKMKSANVRKLEQQCEQKQLEQQQYLERPRVEPASPAEPRDPTRSKSGQKWAGDDEKNPNL